MSTSKMRAFIGFLVAPGLPALILYLINLIFVFQWEAAWGAKLLTLFGYLSALLIGIPVYLFFQRKHVVSLGAYLTLGALIGLTCYALFFGSLALLSWNASPDHALLLLKNSVGSAVIALVYGSVASMVFWLIAIKRTT